MSAGEKGISVIVAIGICLALALTAAGVGVVAVTGGMIIDGQLVSIPNDAIQDYIDANDITIDELRNMTYHEKMSICFEVGKIEMNKSTYEPAYSITSPKHPDHQDWLDSMDR